MARLILESGGERREIKIAGTLVIGRSKSVAVHVDDRLLSRKHTEIAHRDGRYYVRDLESKNGTFLNGDLIRQPELLKHGDRIKVGPAHFTFVVDPGESVAPPPPPLPTALPAAPSVPHRPATSVPGPGSPRLRTRRAAGTQASPAIQFAFMVLFLFVTGVSALIFRTVFQKLMTMTAP